MEATALVKIGGSLAEDPVALRSLCSALAQHHKNGGRLVLVHGGGKEISRNLELLSEKPRFVQGRRVTDEPAMKMVEMTLSGWVNKWLVRMLLAQGVRAVGVSGVDGALFSAQKRTGEPELGLVGEIQQVDPSLIELLWSGGVLPVVSPVSLGEGETALNINADEAAAALADKLQVERLLFVSDVAGVMREGERLPELDAERVAELVDDGVVTGGMIPKTESALKSLEAGIREVHICGWNGAEQFLEQLSGRKNYGTIFR